MGGPVGSGSRSHAGRKGTVSPLPLPPTPHPLAPVTDARLPGGTCVFEFFKKTFGLVFLGTDKCFKQRLYPVETPSLAIFLCFSVHSIFVCVCLFGQLILAVLYIE